MKDIIHILATFLLSKETMIKLDENNFFQGNFNIRLLLNCAYLYWFASDQGNLSDTPWLKQQIMKKIAEIAEGCCSKKSSNECS